jgi:hypothetical protein
VQRTLRTPSQEHGVGRRVAICVAQVAVAVSPFANFSFDYEGGKGLDGFSGFLLVPKKCARRKAVSTAGSICKASLAMSFNERLRR